MLLKGIKINSLGHQVLHLHPKEAKTAMVVILLQLKWDNMVPLFQVHPKEECNKEITNTVVKEVAMEVVPLWGKVMATTMEVLHL